MLKGSLLKITGVIVCSFFLLGIFAVAEAEDKTVKTNVEIKEGKGRLSITIYNGQVVYDSCTHPDHSDSNIKCRNGFISDLRLVMPDDVGTQILNIPDHATIKCGDPTTANPGCTWYFFGGRYWMVCD